MSTLPGIGRNDPIVNAVRDLRPDHRERQRNAPGRKLPPHYVNICQDGYLNAGPAPTLASLALLRLQRQRLGRARESENPA
jgi:hypothetical protein